MSDTFSVNDELNKPNLTFHVVSAKISFCPTLINTFVTWMINERTQQQSLHEHSDVTQLFIHNSSSHLNRSAFHIAYEQL